MRAASQLKKLQSTLSGVQGKPHNTMGKGDESTMTCSMPGRPYFSARAASLETDEGLAPCAPPRTEKSTG